MNARPAPSPLRQLASDYAVGRLGRAAYLAARRALLDQLDAHPVFSDAPAPSTDDTGSTVPVPEPGAVSAVSGPGSGPVSAPTSTAPVSAKPGGVAGRRRWWPWVGVGAVLGLAALAGAWLLWPGGSAPPPPRPVPPRVGTEPAPTAEPASVQAPAPLQVATAAIEELLAAGRWGPAERERFFEHWGQLDRQTRDAVRDTPVFSRLAAEIQALIDAERAVGADAMVARLSAFATEIGMDLPAPADLATTVPVSIEPVPAGVPESPPEPSLDPALALQSETLAQGPDGAAVRSDAGSDPKPDAAVDRGHDLEPEPQQDRVVEAIPDPDPTSDPTGPPPATVAASAPETAPETVRAQAPPELAPEVALPAQRGGAVAPASGQDSTPLPTADPGALPAATIAPPDPASSSGRLRWPAPPASPEVTPAVVPEAMPAASPAALPATTEMLERLLAVVASDDPCTRDATRRARTATYRCRDPFTGSAAEGLDLRVIPALTPFAISARPQNLAVWCERFARDCPPSVAARASAYGVWMGQKTGRDYRPASAAELAEAAAHGMSLGGGAGDLIYLVRDLERPASKVESEWLNHWWRRFHRSGDGDGAAD